MTTIIDKSRPYITLNWLFKSCIINKTPPLKVIILLIALHLVGGCKKLIQIDSPINSVNANNVFSLDATAAAVLTDVYTQMSRSALRNGDLTGLSLYAGLSADEMIPANPNNDPFKYYYRNNLTSINPGGDHFWNKSYQYIFVANSAIEGISNSNTLSPQVKKQLIGEAKFIRAFCYFYLVNLYGGVPLTTTTNYKINANLPRASIDNIYKQIILDLLDAQSLLTENYSEADAKTNTPITDRVRPNKWAAKAMLARVYLFINEWQNAELESSEVIDHSSLFKLNSLDNAFLKNNSEAIWQLQPVNAIVTDNTEEGYIFILPMSGPNDFSNPVYLDDRFVESFEPGDHRKLKWLKSVTINGKVYNYPFKYKLGVRSTELKEYSMVLRLAEQYLIRAEARLHLHNINGTVMDLNVIRTRARENSNIGLPNLLPTINEEQALNAIAYERRVELFSEWGHRWLDLKRTGKANDVLSALKGSDWQNTAQFYPIPQNELDKNPNLKGHQNAGYN
jgi:hypothetical protein